MSIGMTITMEIGQVAGKRTLAAVV